MSHTLVPQGLDIFRGKLSKITKQINETSTEARVYCVVQFGPTPFCQTKTMQILVVCYRYHVTILFNVALQLLLDSCLLSLLPGQLLTESQFLSKV